MANFFDFARVPIMTRMGKPTDMDMELIKRQAPDDEISPEELFVYSARASDGKEDSFHSWMSESTLRNYADDYKEGRSFLLNHDTSQVMGRTYNGEYREGETLISAYVLKDIKIADISSNDFIRSVRAGIRKDVSVRFAGGMQVCDICENEVLSRGCTHMPGQEYDGKKATYGIHEARGAEISSVWKASNSNATILKATDLKARGLLSDRDIDEYNRKYGCNLRADMQSSEIITLAALNLRTDESYLLKAIKARAGTR